VEQSKDDDESLVDVEMPDKLFFRIGEAAQIVGVEPHVLRYWEQEFPQLSPVKRRGNRRYYQREDVELVRTIRSLLYSQGYTIGGARQRLSNERREPTPVEIQAAIRESLSDLEKARSLLSSV
jgi:DNA-binding transcriptional MerR regulator